MNKKINFLAILPFYGTLFLWFWLFHKKEKDGINNKFNIYCTISVLIGSLVIVLGVLLLNFINSLTNLYSFLDSDYAALIAVIVGGYVMNLCSFILINKKWDKIESVY